jgi:hypothetical protein
LTDGPEHNGTFYAVTPTPSEIRVNLYRLIRS